jgi:hypothetical protein
MGSLSTRRIGGPTWHERERELPGAEVVPGFFSTRFVGIVNPPEAAHQIPPDETRRNPRERDFRSTLELLVPASPRLIALEDAPA